jgi:ATP-dependent Clp endopeptidase proteolytic subunit ClpP
VAQRRLIKIISGIDEAAFKEFSDEMDLLEARSSTERIEIELSSGGGSAYDALAFYSRIRMSPCPVRILAFGLVASAAVLVLGAGDVRVMFRESWVMVHEDSSKLNGHVYELERQSAHMRRLENQWNELLAKHTLVDAETWAGLHRATTYLSAAECLELGLIDKII